MIRTFESFSKSLKDKIKDYYGEIIGDFEQEEIDNALEILNDYDDKLSNLSEIDSTILKRIIEDEELLYDIDYATVVSNNENPFG